MSGDESRTVEPGGVRLHVEDHGSGTPVLLIHGWPDSGYLWRHLERYVQDLSRPGALTASLNWYRANLAPRMPGNPPDLPPVTAPTLGVWSANDHYLDGERMEQSGACVDGPWRYEVIPGASHWMALDAPGRLNELLLDWLS